MLNLVLDMPWWVGFSLSFESLNIPRNYVKNGIVIIFMVVHHKKINNSIKIDILVINERARYRCVVMGSDG